MGSPLWVQISFDEESHKFILSQVQSALQEYGNKVLPTPQRKVNIYTTIYKIDSQWEFYVWLRELKLQLCNNLKEWEEVGGEREVQEEGDISVSMAGSCWYMVEINTIL